MFPPKCRFNLLLGLGKCECGGSKFRSFRNGGLGGDFYKGTHEAKMIGMHMGSVLSGLEAANVNSDHKIHLGVRTYALEGSKRRFSEVWRP